MSAATPARDTDSSVEEDPAAGRSVDRAPRHGRSRARRDRRWTLEDQRRGGGPPPEGSEHRQRWRCGLPSRSSPRVIGGDEAGARTRSARAERGTGPGPAENSPRGEERPGEASAGRPADRRGPAHAADGRGATRFPDGRTAHRRGSPSPKGGRKHDSGRLAGPQEMAAPAAMDRTARPAPRLRTGSEGSPSTAARPTQATNGKRGAGRSDAARLPTRSKPSQGGSASGDDGPGPRSFGFDDRSARNLANPDPVPAATCREP